MNKRDRIFSLLDPASAPDVIPAAFFMHFDPACHRGQAAVDKHLEFFHHTDMDFVKIQYEHRFPFLPHIARPADWIDMPCYGEAFFAEPLAVVEGLVKAAKAEAPVVVTLYSPFMCAGQAVGNERLHQHLHEDPEAVKRGMEKVAASVQAFVRACIRLGVDGFYHSTQGGEAGRLSSLELFETCVKPFDLLLMQEIDQACAFNILHVCDYVAGYDDFTRFVDYPGHVVNAPLSLGGRPILPQEVARLFNRPYMGGIERKGLLATGDVRQAQQAAQTALDQAKSAESPIARFILGADCTVPGNTPWDNLRRAVQTAHGYLRAETVNQ